MWDGDGLGGCPKTTHRRVCSEPTVWDGDIEQEPPTPASKLIVPSPPCGMETPMTTIKSIVKTPGSEPTVWDGDCERHDNEEHGQKVPSPPCGMETKVINRAIIGRTTVPSPPCGMETYLWWFLTRYLRACSEPTVWDGDIRPHPKEDITALFRAHCVGWRLAYSFLGLSLFTNVPSPPCGMETRRRGT